MNNFNWLSVYQITFILVVLVEVLCGGNSVFAEDLKEQKLAQPNEVSADESRERAKKDKTPAQVEIIGSLIDRQRYSTTANVIISREEISRYGDSTLSSVLSRVAGIAVTGAQGLNSEIKMRGLGSGYTTILINGEATAPNFPLDSISPDVIERIEIKRVATADMSMQGIAGIINVILKKSVAKAHMEFKLSASDYDGLISPMITTQFSDKQGQLSYSIASSIGRQLFRRSIMQFESEDSSYGVPVFRRAIEQNRKDAIDSINVSPRVTWKLSDTESIVSQSFLNFSKVGTNVGEQNIATLGLPAQFSSSIGGNHTDSTIFRTSVTWSRVLANLAKIESTFGASYNHRHGNAAFLGYDSDDALGLDRGVESDAADKGLSAKGKYTTPFFNDHSVVVGWDGDYSHRHETRVQRDNYSTIGAPINLEESYIAKVARLAMFAQDEWPVTKDLMAYAGIRWEGLDTSTSGNTLTEVHNSVSVWPPVLQAVWKIPGFNKDQFRLGVTRTYKPPQTASLVPRRYYVSNNSPTNPDFIGNPNLKPELAWGLDAVYEHYISDGIFSVSSYARRVQNVILNRLSFDGQGWYSAPNNDGDAFVRGLELDLKMPLKSLSKNLATFDFRGNLARNWSKIDSIPGPNNRLDQQTPFLANIGLDYHPRDSLTVGGNYNFQTAGPARLSPVQGAYTGVKRVFDLYALVKLNPLTRVRFTFSDLLHQDRVGISDYSFVSGEQQQLTTISPTRTVFKIELELKM